MERTPQASLAFARRFAAARARAAERNFFVEAVVVSNGGANTGNECEEADVNTRDEGEVELRGEQQQKAGGFRPMKSSCKQHGHTGDDHSSRGAHEHQPARGITLKISRTQLALEEEDCAI